MTTSNEICIAAPGRSLPPCTPRARRGLVAAAVVTACLFGGRSAPADAAPFAYVANHGNGTVSVIDTATNTVTATIPAGPFPVGVAVSPGGTRVYVTNQNPGGTVTVIDATRHVATAIIPVGQRPAGVAVKLPGNAVYAVNREDGTVSVIDAITNTVIATVPVGRYPQGVAINPAGTPAYVANQNSDTVSVIDTNTNTVKATVRVGHNPTHVAVNPAGTRVYVTNDSFGLVAVIDAATNVVTGWIGVGNYPGGVAVDPRGTRAYVANRGPNTLSVINALGNTVIATVPVGTNPSDVAVNPAGTRVYVANRSSNTVSVIDTTAGNAVTATVPVGLSPVAMGEFIMPALLPPVLAKAVRACQATIAKTARTFALASATREASCRKRILKDAVAGKDTTLTAAVCAQTLDVADPRSSLGRVRGAAMKKIAKKCSGILPSALHSPCRRAARTFDEAADCVLDQHRRQVAEMITMQYGPDPALLLDKPGRACQAALAGQAQRMAKLVHANLAKCLDRVLKDAADDKGIALAAAACARALDPEDPRSQVAKARVKARAKVAKKCAAVLPASLGSPCGAAATTNAALADCVLDEHTARAAKMIAAEYNGACPMLTAVGLGMAFPAACTGP